MTLAAFILACIAAVLTGLGLTRPDRSGPWYGVGLLLVAIAVMLITWTAVK
jgi:hypothetical protein